MPPQVLSVPTPTGLISPIQVTTTFRDRYPSMIHAFLSCGWYFSLMTGIVKSRRFFNKVFKEKASFAFSSLHFKLIHFGLIHTKSGSLLFEYSQRTRHARAICWSMPSRT